MADKDKRVYYWLKLDKDFFNKYKIKSLLSEPKGDTYCLILLQLMNESLNYKGVLRFSPNRAYTLNELAYVINRSPKVLKESLKKLSDKELLNVQEDGTIVIPNVADVVGKETGKAIRMKSYREALKNAQTSGECSEDVAEENAQNLPNCGREIRDKSIEIRYIDDDYKKGIIRRFAEAGYDNKTISQAVSFFDKYSVPVTQNLFSRVINTINDTSIFNKDGYIYEMFRKEGEV